MVYIVNMIKKQGREDCKKRYGYVFRKKNLLCLRIIDMIKH